MRKYSESKTENIQQQLLRRIINKGGLMAYCANLYVDHPEQAKQFILECSEQCHNQPAIDFWGKELVSDIVNFAKENKHRVNPTYL